MFPQCLDHAMKYIDGLMQKRRNSIANTLSSRGCVKLWLTQLIQYDNYYVSRDHVYFAHAIIFVVCELARKAAILLTQDIQQNEHLNFLIFCFVLLYQ